MSALERIRRVLRRVPRGAVITYGQAAAYAGFPGAPRLTVRALQKGEDLPWHRVVAAGGRIALRGEEGREQRRRLEIEGVKFRGAKVRMELHNWTPRGRRRAPTRPRPRRARPTTPDSSPWPFQSPQPARRRD